MVSTGVWKGQAWVCFHMALMMLLLMMAILLVWRPRQPAGGWKGGWYIPLTGVTFTSGLAGGLLSWLEGRGWEGWLFMAGEETAPPPGTARGLRVNRLWGGAIRRTTTRLRSQRCRFNFWKKHSFDSTISITIHSWRCLSDTTLPFLSFQLTGLTHFYNRTIQCSVLIFQKVLFLNVA